MKYNIVSKPYIKNLSIIFKKEIFKKKNRKILLTGGNTFKQIYSNININPKSNHLKKKLFFVTDERINVKLKDTNFKNIKKNFFKNKNIKIFFYFNFKDNNIKNSLKKYSSLLPKAPDLVFLSLGSGGHVASIFKNSNLLEIKQKLGFKKKSKFMGARISISMNYINRSKKIILVVGSNKSYELKNFLLNRIKHYPAFKINKKNILIYIYDKEYNKVINL